MEIECFVNSFHTIDLFLRELCCDLLYKICILILSALLKTAHEKEHTMIHRLSLDQF